MEKLFSAAALVFFREKSSCVLSYVWKLEKRLNSWQSFGHRALVLCYNPKKARRVILRRCSLTLIQKGSIITRGKQKKFGRIATFRGWCMMIVEWFARKSRMPTVLSNRIHRTRRKKLKTTIGHTHTHVLLLRRQAVTLFDHQEGGRRRNLIVLCHILIPHNKCSPPPQAVLC